MINRELIERDQKYRRFKRIVINMMSVHGVTEWYTDEQWIDAVKFNSINAYHHVVGDMLDDSEIKREYDRDQSPVKSRWVLKDARD